MLYLAVSGMRCIILAFDAHMSEHTLLLKGVSRCFFDMHFLDYNKYSTVQPSYATELHRRKEVESILRGFSATSRTSKALGCDSAAVLGRSWHFYGGPSSNIALGQLARQSAFLEERGLAPINESDTRTRGLDSDVPG